MAPLPSSDSPEGNVEKGRQRRPLRKNSHAKVSPTKTVHQENASQAPVEREVVGGHAGHGHDRRQSGEDLVEEL